MNWDRLTGVSLAGEYPLQRILGESESGAWFETFSEARNASAVLEVIKEEAETGEQQLACWRRVRLLHHPNLQLLYDCGRTMHHGEALLYAVLENPDDSLDTALSQGGLSETESKEVLDAISGALEYLHAQGLVHGAVDPRHIVAVGDRIKLTTDTVRPATDGEDGDELDALRDALGIRSAASVAIAPEPESQPVPEPQPAAPVVEEVVPRASVATVGAAMTEPVRARDSAPTRPLAAKKPFWPFLAAAAGLVGVVVAIAHRPAAPSKPATVSTGAPAATANATPPAATAPPVPSVVPRRAPAAVAHRSVPEPVARTEWRVIAYTYSRLKDAEHKAQTINQKMPGFHAEVFSPKGRNQPPYLVALGGRMTRSDAASLQRRAIGRGMPRDTFIRNYND